VLHAAETQAKQDAWPGLPLNVKAGIVAMVKATNQGGSVEGRD